MIYTICYYRNCPNCFSTALAYKKYIRMKLSLALFTECSFAPDTSDFCKSRDFQIAVYYPKHQIYTRPESNRNGYLKNVFLKHFLDASASTFS